MKFNKLKFQQRFKKVQQQTKMNALLPCQHAEEPWREVSGGIKGKPGFFLFLFLWVGGFNLNFLNSPRIEDCYWTNRLDKPKQIQQKTII